MSDQDLCGKCNRGNIEKTGKYFYAVFNDDYNNFEKWLCQNCWEQEEEQYRQGQKIIQRGSEKMGQVSQRIVYDWNTKQWTNNKLDRENKNKPNDQEVISIEKIRKYMKDNKIFKITLADGDDLDITYQNEGKNITSYTTLRKSAKEGILQQIKTHLQQTPSKVITMDNLSEREIQEPKSNTILYVCLGIGGLVLVGIIAYFLLRKNNKE